VQGVLVDISESKKARELVQEGEERYRRIIENAGDIVFSVNGQGEFIYISPNCETVPGYRDHEFIGASFEQFVHPEDVGRIYNAMSAVFEEYRRSNLNEGGWCRGEIIGLNLANLIDPHDRPAAREALESIKNGQVMRLEMRVRRKDSSYGWYSLVNRPLYDKNAQIIAITGIARNIDHTKSIEQALRESERQKNLILNATSEMIAYYDTDLRIIWANQAAAESVGSQPENLVWPSLLRGLAAAQRFLPELPFIEDGGYPQA